jgi:hypothetical protein
LPESPEVAHAAASRDGLAASTVSAEPASRKAITASSAVSLPGQSMPTPSPAQKIPNDVSRKPIL